MKIKTAGIILLWLASINFACADTNNITTLVQKGLFEEEANHRLDAAIESYQDAIEHFAKDRELTATAIFHLGECYRLQGKTNEANAQYQRILHEFSDQAQLAELSRNYLPKAAATVYPQSISMNLDNTEPPSDEEREIRRINDMIQNSPDLINAPQESGNMTPLVHAAQEGWMSAAKLLLENGVEVNAVSPTSYTPLSAAADAGNKGMIEFLLSKGAKPNAGDGRTGYTPLDYAIEHGFKTVAETLLAHGADVNAPAKSGDRPLHIAARRGDTAMAELLLAHKADVNAPGKGGETALFRAIQNNKLDMVQLLLSNKANVNIKSASDVSPLVSAMNKTTGIDIVKLLLNSGANIETTSEDHHPLDIAVNQDRGDLVELFLQQKADPNLETRWRVWVKEIVAPAYNEHSIPTEYNDHFVTPLILAITRNSAPQRKIVESLLQHGANPNLADDTGHFALDYAIWNINTNIIAQLILHHADVNALDKKGQPPLAYLSRLVSEGAAKDRIKAMLLQAGANEDYQRSGAIFITEKGSGSIGHEVFSKGTDSLNHHTLLGLIAKSYGQIFGIRAGEAPSSVAFPDFAHVTVNRLKSDGGKEEFNIDVNQIFQSEDCSKNIQLEWGDIVLIPQLDHNVNDFWPGLSDPEKKTLAKCLMRKVNIVVKGQTNQFTLEPRLGNIGGIGISAAGNISFPQYPQRTTLPLPPALSWHPPTNPTSNPEKVLYAFDIKEVITDANVLLISSDLSRVKLIRDDPKNGGHPLVVQLNLETDAQSRDIQLEDGDVVEIPERDQK